jgi:hypothetical protein
MQRLAADEERGGRHQGDPPARQVRLEVEQPLGDANRGEVAEVAGERHLAREPEEPHVGPAEQGGDVGVAVRRHEEGGVDPALLEPLPRLRRGQAQEIRAGRGQPERAEQGAGDRFGATARRADGETAAHQRGEAVRHRLAAIEDPERLAVHRRHATQPTVRILDELIGTALDEGHVHLPAEQAFEILEGAGGPLELDAKTFSGEAALILVAEDVVHPVGLAGGEPDAAGRKRIHVAQAQADDGGGEYQRHHPEREPAPHRRANSSLTPASRAGSASRSTALRAMSFAPASSPARAGGAAAAAANSRV